MVRWLAVALPLLWLGGCSSWDEPCGAGCAEAAEHGAASFLQLGRRIPIQQKFDMKCTCSKEVRRPHCRDARRACVLAMRAAAHSLDASLACAPQSASAAARPRA